MEAWGSENKRGDWLRSGGRRMGEWMDVRVRMVAKEEDGREEEEKECGRGAGG